LTKFLVSLSQKKGKKEEAMFRALQLLLTKSMQLAKYCCTGIVERDGWKHYALHMDEYTHFTRFEKLKKQKEQT